MPNGAYSHKEIMGENMDCACWFRGCMGFWCDVALKPLSVGGPDTVVRIERWFQSGSSGTDQYAFSYPEYAFYRDHNSVFSSVVAASWPFRIFAALPETDAAKSARLGEPEKATA